MGDRLADTIPQKINYAVENLYETDWCGLGIQFMGGPEAWSLYKTKINR